MHAWINEMCSLPMHHTHILPLICMSNATLHILQGRTALRSSTFSVFTEFNQKVQFIYIDFCNPVASVIWDWDWVKYPFLKAWHMSIWCFVVQMATVSLWHFIFLGKQLVIFLLGVRHLSHIESSMSKCQRYSKV